ncbi:hypothetical protein C9I28_21095 [Pseudoduganella armeniaca]|uniref:Uncharacterized protein n=1 Tax=Pseudoduganella armeniaca TaxID=2072590 RepID=A0A2R4CDY2_9BURK|nr:hypothetical protein C9I28_21095 [Pseudoduganella armeniaca]
MGRARERGIDTMGNARFIATNPGHGKERACAGIVRIALVQRIHSNNDSKRGGSAIDDIAAPLGMRTQCREAACHDIPEVQCERATIGCNDVHRGAFVVFGHA